MTFDLRVPIGLLFSVCGGILAVDGLVERAYVLGINVNLWWGAVMLLFGVAMLFFAMRASRAS
jgi:hypothetical protein